MMRRDSIVDRLVGLPWFLLMMILGLASLGIVVLFSAGSGEIDPLTGNQVLNAQLSVAHAWRFGLLLLLALGLALVPMRLWAAAAYPAYFVGVVCLILVELFGVTVNGAERWLQIGPLRVQPSELMKLAVPLALARFYHQIWEGERQSFWSHLWALIIVVIPTILVLRQPDLGTALTLMAAGFAVIFFAGISLRIVVAVMVMVAAATPLIYFFALHEYQRRRVETLFNPEADPLGAGYQLQQALIAIGSGGVTGKGFLEGEQKQLDYIPEQHTDFIFTIVAEEFGFMGSLALLILWAVVIVQGMNIALRSRNLFGGLAAAGFVSTLFFYVTINIGMVIGLLPVVGIPLPLVSYGGNVMMTVMVGFGFLMAAHLNRDHQMAIRGVF